MEEKSLGIVKYFSNYGLGICMDLEVFEDDAGIYVYSLMNGKKIYVTWIDGKEGKEIQPISL